MGQSEGKAGALMPDADEIDKTVQIWKGIGREVARQIAIAREKGEHVVDIGATIKIKVPEEGDTTVKAEIEIHIPVP